MRTSQLARNIAIVGALAVACLFVLQRRAHRSRSTAPAQTDAPQPQAAFDPVLLGVDLVPPTPIRPGGVVSYTLRFANHGAFATRDYRVYVHFEPRGRGCEANVLQHDHDPHIPTSMWQPGEIVYDGPRLIVVPRWVAEGEYEFHVGLFDRDGDQSHALDVDAATIRIARDAPPVSDWRPEPLSAAELDRRRAALRARLTDPVALCADDWTFALDRASGAFALEDRRTGVVWSSNSNSSRFGRVQWTKGARAVDMPIERFDSVELVDGRLVARCSLSCPRESTPGAIVVTASRANDGGGLSLTADSEPPPGWETASLTILDHAFTSSDADEGYTIAPCWLGQLRLSDTGLPNDRYFGTDDVSMQMSGAVKQGSALMIAWPDPAGVLVMHGSLEDSPLVAGRRAQSLSLELHERAREVEIQPLGAGDYADIARAYRGVAARNGWRSTWIEKRRMRPDLARLEGAAEFRFSGFMRIAPRSRSNPLGFSVIRMDATFDELAACARHWHDDLGIDRANVIAAGWNREGYDRGFPDILPANPECGGDAALSAAACTVDGLGYVFTLHDNYVDIYTDAPSWDPDVVSRGDSGEMRRGGDWFGGTSFRVCGAPQLAFAQRNLPRVASLYHPSAAFLDSTLTTRLEDCTHPSHPMTRWDDQRERVALFDYARGAIGMLGLEGGREWAVPHADWFEGMLTQKTIHMPDWVIVPMFPLVYGDCVSLVPVQADKLGVDDAAKVLDLALYGAVPSYDFGPHVYFASADEEAVPLKPEIARFTPVSSSSFRLMLKWNVRGRVEKDLRVFVHFTSSASRRPEGTAFQGDHVPDPPTSTWVPGQTVETGGALVEIPASEEGDAEWDVRVGVAYRGRRLALESLWTTDLRAKIGVLRRSGGQLELRPASRTANDACFSRADDGWARDLGTTDRMIKNTYEVLSWLNRLVVDRGPTAHRFLTADRSVEQTEFGDVVVTANFGERTFELANADLPQFGFLIESPRFVAFHATRYRETSYPTGALFTLRALDGERLDRARRIRVFHGFGATEVQVGATRVNVEREAIVDGSGGH